MSVGDQVVAQRPANRPADLVARTPPKTPHGTEPEESKDKDERFHPCWVTAFLDLGEFRVQWHEPFEEELYSTVQPHQVRYAPGTTIQAQGPDGRRWEGAVRAVYPDGSYRIILNKTQTERKVAAVLVRLPVKRAREDDKKDKKKKKFRDADAHPLGVMPCKTGCARAEGYKPIPWAIKQQYLQFQFRPTLRSDELKEPEPVNKPGKVGSTAFGRASRLANRNYSQGISGAGAVGSDLFRFSQLKARVKRLSFRKSTIHGWGLYADETIDADEMVIEYKGELISNKVCEVRERQYERSGIGSSYMFRVSRSCIIDATHIGGRARYVNHSCEPNCYTRIIHVGGKPKVVLYSKRVIEEGEELSYDYNFSYEDGDVPCHCGAQKCRGYMA